MFFKIIISAFLGALVGFFYSTLFYRQLFGIHQKSTTSINQQIIHFALLFLIRYLILALLIGLCLIIFSLHVIAFILLFGSAFWIALMKKR